MRDVTGVDLVKLVQEAYDLSSPQGMGFLHAVDGPLDETEAAQYVRDTTDRVAVSCDYIRGRAVKLVVFRNVVDGRLTLRDDWYDHTARQDAELWQRLGVTPRMLQAT